MKNIFWITIGCLFLFDCKGDKKLILTNNDSSSRMDEPVIITRAYLNSIFNKDVSAFFPLIVSSHGDTIASQTDDIDGDGKWDELFLLSDFGPFEQKEFQISLIVPANKPLFAVKANLRFAKVIVPHKKYEAITQAERLKSTATELSQAAFQMEGPAWESDKVAFRNYFDARNGIDIYGKVTSRMVLDTVGTGEDYHSMLWWGMDILHVGNSLGAGAIGLQTGDTLYRLDLPEQGGFEAVSRGPLRIIFRLNYKNWHVKDQVYNVIHEISTWGGFYGYQSKITLSGSKENVTLISGIVNVHSDTLYVKDSNASYTAIYTHDKQAEKGEFLGLGLILPNKNFLGHAKARNSGSGIIQTFYARLKARDNEPLEFRFYAGWQKSKPEFGTATQYGKFLEAEAERMSKAILIKFE